MYFMHWFSKFMLLFFSVQNFHLVLLYIFYFFAETFYFSICFKHVHNCSSIFMMADLNACQIIPTFMSSWHSYLIFRLRLGSSYDKWFFYWILGLLGIVMRLCVFFKSFSRSTLTSCWQGKWSSLHHYHVDVEVQILHSASIDTLWSEEYPITAGCCRGQSSPLVLCWHYPG